MGHWVGSHMGLGFCSLPGAQMPIPHQQGSGHYPTKAKHVFSLLGRIFAYVHVCV